MTDLEQRMEEFLLAEGDWVASRRLCALFAITERQLRAVGDQPGLCSSFAISSDKGFKHVSKATPTEYRTFKHRLRRHAIAELVRVRNLDKRRHQVTVATKRPEFIRERDTNQGLLFSMPQPRPW
jgi:hypothetical protein